MSKLILTVKGNSGKLLVYDDKVYFERKSVLGHIGAALDGTKTSYGYEKSITYENINGVEFNKASMWRNGYISLAVEGEIKNMDGLKGASKNATSLIFFPGANEDAERAVQFINNKIKEKISASNNAVTNNIAEELEKLFSLKEKNILSEEEFQQAKERLLK